MCIYIYIYTYIYYLPPVIIHLSPFINYLKTTLKVTPDQKSNHKPFYYTKFVIALVKGLHLVREMQECTTKF